MSSIVDNLDYVEFAIYGDTSDNRRRRSHNKGRQVSGDYTVYVDEFNDNLLDDVVINIADIVGVTEIDDFYHYEVKCCNIGNQGNETINNTIIRAA